MEISRRRFTSAAAAAVVAPSIPGLVWARQGIPGGGPGVKATILEWSELVDGAFVAKGGGGNSLLVRSGHQAALIDTKLCGYGAVLGREIGLQGAVVEMVLNTHHHGDHTGGNSAFTDSVRVIAHEKAKPRILNQREKYRGAARSSLNELAKSDPEGAEALLETIGEMVGGWDQVETDAFAPTETISGDASFRVGEQELLVRHAGAGHTDNDVFIYMPGMNVLHTGDLVFHEVNAYLDTTAGVTIDGWINSCEKMLELCDARTVVVPGHGEVTDRSGIQQQIDYFRLLRRTVSHARDTQGLNKETVQEMVPSALEEYGFPGLLSRNLGLLYDKEV